MRHNAVQDAHTVQVYLTVSDGENTGDSTGTGTSPAGKNWPRSWFDTDGFGEGLIAGVIGVAVLILLCFCARALVEGAAAVVRAERRNYSRQANARAHLLQNFLRSLSLTMMTKLMALSYQARLHRRRMQL